MSDPRDASGYSASDLISMGFIATPSLAALVERTQPVSEISVAKFDAIVVAGGQAPMFSFEKATSLHAKFVEFYEAGRSRPRCATASPSSGTRSSAAASTSRRARP
jgi:hypothetical protein